MSWRNGLSKQILLSMAVVTVVSGIIIFASFYLAWACVATFFPESVYSDSWISGWDLLTLLGANLFSLLVAAGLAMKLASRILAPLNSLAESARQIAGGNLSARARPGDRSLGEVAQLVDDFNTMAQRLQDMGDNVAYWNAAIAHELRTPLTILKGKLQAVSDGVFCVDDKLIESLTIQTDGLARLVNDLRVVTLADAGRLDLHLQPVNLANEIRKTVEIIESSLQQAGFLLELTLVDIIVEADAIRLRQVLLALLNNAQRYAKPGLVRIFTLIAGDKAVIRIEDSGPGLPPDFDKHAFDPFTRADTSRSRLHGGTGLGLSVVRAIVEAHGGETSCRNSSRGGAVFEIQLPQKT